MATIQEISPQPWRLALLPASFSGVRYHVEQQNRSSGRRLVVHEYPKRSKPSPAYAEDMGRQPIRYSVTGYLIGPNYHTEKQRLINVLENTEGGTLIDPYLPKPLKCCCERYSVSETRERGGICTFEMAFVEAGIAGNSQVQSSTATDAANQAQNSARVAELNTNSFMSQQPTSV